MKILNIYGQYDHHSEARIVGNRQGLEMLRKVIDKALQCEGVTTTIAVPGDFLTASDGEGFDLAVVMCNDQWGWNSAKGEKLDPDSFWNKEESKPQYTYWQIQEALIEQQGKLGIDYFAGELTIGMINKRGG